ncbi:MAG: Tfp pilus assembly protein FimT/FimU [Lachnospiraceae bacterium]
MKKNNQGITLIELIVVIAIMAVLTASFAVSLTLISRQKVSNAANSTKSLLQLAQTYSKSKDRCLVRFTGFSDGSSEVSIYTYDTEDNLKMGNGPTDINKNINVVIKYEDNSGATYEVTVASGVSADIKFNRSTGGFDQVQVPGEADGTLATPVQIRFTNGEKVSVLDLATNTGVVTFESQTN